jgi:hypothetical protein
MLTIYANTGLTDLALGIGEFEEIDTDNDSLIFSAGSDSVKDQEPLPSQTQLNSAGILLTGIEQTVPHYFLADISAVLLKEIHNMGNKDKMYVFCFSFDAATASEPVLELWDDDTMDSIDLYSLGEGDSDDSWWKGIVTTDGTPPGADWVGSKLAGAADGHFLWLNRENGALTVAKDLYCQLKVIVPANFTVASTEHPIFAVKYTSN